MSNKKGVIEFYELPDGRITISADSLINLFEKEPKLHLAYEIIKTYVHEYTLHQNNLGCIASLKMLHREEIDVEPREGESDNT